MPTEEFNDDEHPIGYCEECEEPIFEDDESARKVGGVWVCGNEECQVKSRQKEVK